MTRELYVRSKCLEKKNALRRRHSSKQLLYFLLCQCHVTNVILQPLFGIYNTCSNTRERPTTQLVKLSTRYQVLHRNSKVQKKTPYNKRNTEQTHYAACKVEATTIQSVEVAADVVVIFFYKNRARASATQRLEKTTT